MLYDAEIPLLMKRSTKLRLQKSTYVWMCIVTLFIIIPNWEQSEWPANSWTDKQIIICVYNGIRLSKKNEQITDTHNMDEFQTHFPKWEEPNLKGYRTYDAIYMIS